LPRGYGLSNPVRAGQWQSHIRRRAAAIPPSPPKMKRAPTGPFFIFVRGGPGLRTLFDRRSGAAACLVAKRQSHPLRQTGRDSLILSPETRECLFLSGGLRDSCGYHSGPPGGPQTGIGRQIEENLCGRFRRSGIGRLESRELRVDWPSRSAGF